VKLPSWLTGSKQEASAPTSGSSVGAVQDWFLQVFGGKPTGAGMNIGHDNALRIIAVYACVRVLSQGVASLPLILYKRTKDGKERATRHPLYGLMHDSPNDRQTAFEFVEHGQSCLAMRGNAYSYIERDFRGQVVGVWPLNPEQVQLAEASNGDLFYESTELNRTLPAREVLHLRGMSLDGKLGLSPIALAREGLGLAMAAELHGATLFGNGATPTGAVKMPKPLTEEQANDFRKSWRKVHGGADNANKIAILHSGMEYQQVGLSPEDAQFLETRKFQIAEIARLFGVPAHMINDLERATFSNVEHMSLAFVVHTLRPWLVRWEQRLNQSLLTPSERKKYFFEFKVDGLLRGDTNSRYSAYHTGRQGGWLSVNDIRAMENLNPVEGGDEYLSPLNMKDAKEAADDKPTDDSTDEPAADDGGS